MEHHTGVMVVIFFPFSRSHLNFWCWHFHFLLYFKRKVLLFFFQRRWHRQFLICLGNSSNHAGIGLSSWLRCLDLVYHFFEVLDNALLVCYATIHSYSDGSASSVQTKLVYCGFWNCPGRSELVFTLGVVLSFCIPFPRL